MSILKGTRIRSPVYCHISILAPSVMLIVRHDDDDDVVVVVALVEETVAEVVEVGVGVEEEREREVEGTVEGEGEGEYGWIDDKGDEEPTSLLSCMLEAAEVGLVDIKKGLQTLR